MIGKKNKYNNKKIIHDGIKFDSKDEMHYYNYLLKLKAAGRIVTFELQPKYIVQDKFKNNEGSNVMAITYAPDFLVYHNDGSLEAVDVKTMGTATQQGEIRRKMFWKRYPDIKLTWICRHISRARIDGEWIRYEDLKKEMAAVRRSKKKIEEEEAE